jgi:hypothetical protein
MSPFWASVLMSYPFITLIWMLWQYVEMLKDFDGEFVVSTLLWPVTLVALSPILIIKGLRLFGIGAKNSAGGVPRYIKNIKDIYTEEISK